VKVRGLSPADEIQGDRKWPTLTDLGSKGGPSSNHLRCPREDATGPEMFRVERLALVRIRKIRRASEAAAVSQTRTSRPVTLDTAWRFGLVSPRVGGSP
jgi:hypothetical protein